MSWRDVLAHAARNVGRRPARAALTVIAVALAASLFAALLTIAGTARTRVLDQLSKGGSLAGIKVAAAEFDPSQVGIDDARPGRSLALDNGALAKFRALPGVKSVVGVRAAGVLVLPPLPLKLADGRSVSLADRARRRDRLDGATFETMLGVNGGFGANLPISVLAGRLPLPGSQVEVAVTPAYLVRFGLTKVDAKAFVGTELQIGDARQNRDDGGHSVYRPRWFRAIVVGVVAQEASTGSVVANDVTVRADRAWAKGGENNVSNEYDSPYVGAFVVAKGLSRVGGVRNRIQDIGYSTSAPENLVATVQRYLKVVEIVLSGIGFIALTIAALGVSNALLAAVRERRREIGVLKAIGARDRDIRRLFLVEAGVLGLAGGVIGTAAGLGVATLVGAIVNGYLTSQGLTGVRAALPVYVLLGGVLGAGLLAVVAGAIPAQRAARLPAREAVDA